MSSSHPLAPRDQNDCFRDAVNTVGQATAILGRLRRIPADHAAVHAGIAILADRSEDMVRAAPADRRHLGRSLHSVLIHLRTTAERANRHRVTSLAEELAEVIGIVEECGRHTAGLFAAPFDPTWAAWYRAEILRLADDADDAFRRLFARWYFDTDDLSAVAGMREVSDELENVMRAFEEVADAVPATVADQPSELPR
ncbi:hypothetical protein [Nocardia abscessus]|uniref:hypothetical protein n=1 Tax=Nocardia abscessus TaxID=120957 RepID=UPI0024554D71|nr:hypothetical protein [Nocardia abscessus]